jgi:uncharacterized protein
MAAWRHGAIIVLLSAYILDELRRVLLRLAHRHDLTTEEINDLVDVFSIQAEVIEPLPGVEPDLRDVDVQPVLGTLLAALETSGADYLITGDKDLLVITDRYPIVSSAMFWEKHAGL